MERFVVKVAKGRLRLLMVTQIQTRTLASGREFLVSLVKAAHRVKFEANFGDVVVEDRADAMRLALLLVVGGRSEDKFLHAADVIFKDLPGEVVLYWFTACFYGPNKNLFRAALRKVATSKKYEF